MFQLEAKTPDMREPLKIVHQTEDQDYSYITELKSELGGQKTLFKWELGTFPQGGVKTWDIAFDMRAIKDVFKALSNMVGVTSGPITHSYAFENERSTYRSRYTRSSHDTHSFKVDSPSRTVEIETTYSPSRAGIKIYPNRSMGEHKYEVAGEYRKNPWDNTSSYEGRVSHPMLARDMTAKVEYTSSGHWKQGSFELDIFPATEDKITGSLSSVTRANNTVVVEASLSSRVSVIKVHC